MNRFLAQLLEGVGEGAGVDITDKGISNFNIQKREDYRSKYVSTEDNSYT